MIRPRQHEIDTLARRKVPLEFSEAWEQREMTGTDYGIDMIIEVFNNGIATGNYLALQIKGTTQDLETNDMYIKYDIPVKTLKYAELFNSPVLLTLCFVEKERETYYLWLQKYIEVVLDFDNPEWRNNKSTVRLNIPKKNIVYENTDKLRWISYEPKRKKEFSKLASLCIDNEYYINSFRAMPCFDYFTEDTHNPHNTHDEMQRNYLKKILNNIDSMLELHSIFNEPLWLPPQAVLRDSINPARESIVNLLKGVSVDLSEVNINIIKLRTVNNLINTLNNNEYSKYLFDTYRDHDF